MAAASTPSTTSKASVLRRMPDAESNEEDILAKKVRTFLIEPFFQKVDEWPEFGGASIPKYFDIFNAQLVGAGCYGTVYKITLNDSVKREDLAELTKQYLKNEDFDDAPDLNPSQMEELVPGASYIVKTEVAYQFATTDAPSKRFTVPSDGAMSFPSQLLIEYQTLANIQNKYGCEGMRGFTKVFAFGYFAKSQFIRHETPKRQAFHFMIMELCASNIENLMLYTNTYPTTTDQSTIAQKDHKLTVRCAFMIGEQLLSRLRLLHSLGYVHCDLKQDQLMMGRGRAANVVYLVDFGLARPSIDHTGNTDQVGNKRMAPRVHYNCKGTHYLDDLESFCYVLFRLLKNFFPWDGEIEEINRLNQEKQDAGKEVENMMSGEHVVRDKKNALWQFAYHITRKQLSEEDLKMAAKFFDDRNDDFGDGAEQVRQIMATLQEKYTSRVLECFYFDISVKFQTIDYDELRAILLEVFDLSMFLQEPAMVAMESAEENPVLAQARDKSDEKQHAALVKNLTSCIERTKKGMAVYHYYVPARGNKPSNDAFWDWYCNTYGYLSNVKQEPKWYRHVLANRELLRKLLKSKKSK